jgi:uncharacterized protein
MTTHTERIAIEVDDVEIAGTLLSPGDKVPGVLFIHGWGGSQQRDIIRAKGIAGLGCVCLTFDLRGHQDTEAQLTQVSRQHNLDDILAAYDQLARHPAIDPACIAVIGTSYGGYLATILSERRPVRWLALRAPALYWDDEWTRPKHSLDRKKLAQYRQQVIAPEENRALTACTSFSGDVLLVESEHDDFVPHQVLINYRSAFMQTTSMTHRIIKGADHALSSEASQTSYTDILTAWISEMVIGARVGHYPGTTW